jgi:hypothetical protein
MKRRLMISVSTLVVALCIASEPAPAAAANPCMTTISYCVTSCPLDPINWCAVNGSQRYNCILTGGWCSWLWGTGCDFEESELDCYYQGT